MDVHEGTQCFLKINLSINLCCSYTIKLQLFLFCPCIFFFSLHVKMCCCQLISVNMKNAFLSKLQRSFLKRELFTPFGSCLFKSLKSLDQISLFVQQKIDFASKNGVGLKENIQKYANKQR